MILLGLISSYREAGLVQGAIRSALTACDHVLVFEGPAGEPITDCPSSDFGRYKKDQRVTFKHGGWPTDAAKRQAMLEASRKWPAPVWGVIIDADEVLFNGEYLRDWLQRLEWDEEATGKVYGGRPMRIVELGGEISWVSTRLMRLDRMDNYEVSTSVFVNSLGIREARGNVIDKYSEWAEPRAAAFENDQRLYPAPIPTEPFLVHRSGLRHPNRQKLRLHEQERSEIDRVQALDEVTV